MNIISKVAVVSFLGIGGLLNSAVAKLPVVAITQLVSHPALDMDYQGIVDELKDEGYIDGETVRIEHKIAQGDMSIAQQVASNFVGMHPDVMVGISTPSAQSLAAISHNRYPIVFTAVTDPIAAKLVKNIEKPGRNITGVSDEVPMAANVDTMLKILPDMKKIGTIYNPGEANSISANKKLEAAAAAKGLQLVALPATKTSDVFETVQALVGKVDAIYITTDNTVVSALSSVIQVAEKNDIPVFTADTSSVKKGAIASSGFSYYDIGRETGKQVARILKGEKAGDLPVTYLKDPKLYVNPEAAKRIGLHLPEAVIKSAYVVVQEDK